MPGSTVSAFTDADACLAAIRARQVESVVIGAGPLSGHLPDRGSPHMDLVPNVQISRLMAQATAPAFVLGAVGRMEDEWLDRWPDGVCSSAGQSSRSRAAGIGITLSGRRPAFAQAEHAGAGGPAFAIPRPGLALRLCSIAGQPRAKGGH